MLSSKNVAAQNSAPTNLQIPPRLLADLREEMSNFIQIFGRPDTICYLNDFSHEDGVDQRKMILEIDKLRDVSERLFFRGLGSDWKTAILQAPANSKENRAFLAYQATNALVGALLHRHNGSGSEFVRSPMAIGSSFDESNYLRDLHSTAVSCMKLFVDFP